MLARTIARGLVVLTMTVAGCDSVLGIKDPTAANAKDACAGCGGSDSSMPMDGRLMDSPQLLDSMLGDAGMPNGKRVFVTSGSFDGNLRQAGGATTGLAGADALCHTAATALGGTWRAWISDGTTSAINHVTGNGPWVDVFGNVVFANRTDLANVPRFPSGIHFDETGNPVQDGLGAWTATGVGGGSLTSTCTGFTSNASTDAADVGFTGTNSTQWTDAQPAECVMKQRLFCFEL